MIKIILVPLENRVEYLDLCFNFAGLAQIHVCNRFEKADCFVQTDADQSENESKNILILVDILLYCF